jgi:hypothetical protein
MPRSDPVELVPLHGTSHPYWRINTRWPRAEETGLPMIAPYESAADTIAWSVF